MPLSRSAAFPCDELLCWYKTGCRSLPWRKTKDPYRIWISEVMLQQTQVATVIPYYERFLKRFPRVSDLASAAEQEVLKAWENLGYYRRARQLHRAAGIILRNYNGRIPENREELQKLPGIGSYTAGAILSIAYGQDVPAIDGNVRRVLCRCFALGGIKPDNRGIRFLSDLITPLMPPGRSGDFNQALMELGATVCLTRKPLCNNCPLEKICVACRNDCPEAFPGRFGKQSIPLRHAVAAIVRDVRNRVMMVQRPPEGLLGSLWAFPGGFLQNGEDPAQALKRTLQAEHALHVHGEMYITKVRHAYTHFRLILHVFSCRILHAAAPVQENRKFSWLEPGEIKVLPLSKVDRAAAACAGIAL